MKNILYALVFLFTPFLKAQNGYEVKINVKNTTKEKIFLSIYSGTTSKFSTLDSASLQGKSSVTFTQKAKIIGGIFRLHYDKKDKTNFINIDIENGSKIEVDAAEDAINFTTKDPLNSAFFDMQKSSARADRKVGLETIKKRFPNSSGALYAKLELKEFEIPKDSIKSKIYRDHYFSDIDLNDKRIKILPNIYSTLFNYIRVLPISNANYKSSIDNLLRNQNCKSPNYMFYIKWIFMNLEYLNKYRLDDTYSYVFNTYFNNMECIKGNEKYYDQIVKKLPVNVKLPVGDKVPEVEMLDLGNREYKLSEIYSQHDYTFIIFYDPDCQACQKKIPEVKSFFEQKKMSKDLQIIAFHNVAVDAHWKTFVREQKMENWLNVKGKSQKYVQDFDVSGNPNYFLIDRNGKVVLKNFNMDELYTILK